LIWSIIDPIRSILLRCNLLFDMVYYRPYQVYSIALQPAI